mmetsp:Transcript_59250/g.134150  ORF Transcript_59250/g.134150 Transcript_59250/m.134150 type:complete len:231 (-) Transcript_59250:590-1282(-)
MVRRDHLVTVRRDEEGGHFGGGAVFEGLDLVDVGAGALFHRAAHHGEDCLDGDPRHLDGPLLDQVVHEHGERGEGRVEHQLRRPHVLEQRALREHHGAHRAHAAAPERHLFETLSFEVSEHSGHVVLLVPAEGHVLPAAEARAAQVEGHQAGTPQRPHRLEHPGPRRVHPAARVAVQVHHRAAGPQPTRLAAARRARRARSQRGPHGALELQALVVGELEVGALHLDPRV